MILWRSLFLTFLFLALAATRGLAQSNNRDTAWELYAEAQKKLQVAMHHLMTLRWPELKEVLDLTLDIQLAEVDERSLKFYFLKENFPDRIIAHQNLETYAGFAWTEMDSEALGQKNEAFQKLGERIQTLNRAQEANPLWPEVRKKFEGLAESQDPEYLEIMARFKKMTAEVEEMLNLPQ